MPPGNIAGLSANFPILQQIIYYDGEGDWREINARGPKIQAVTAADVKRVANEYFTKENRTVAIYTRKPGTTPSEQAPGSFTLNACAMKKIYQFIFAVVPKGHDENSPAFQRRDAVVTNGESRRDD